MSADADTGAPVPKAIRQAGPLELGITWEGGEESIYPVRALRQACPCAVCVDEMTGRRVVDPESIPLDVRPVRIEGVGRYAIRIHWSDGHNTGLYSYRYLRDLRPAAGPMEV